MTTMAPRQRPPLDRWRFDELAGGAEKIWGLEAIAKVLGVSSSTARRWADLDDVPIYRPAGVGAYFALRSELIAWLRSK
ncbi:helix-turn-helix transcriptional regulator [Salipiger bermudensis]|uniref:helix-turn-helix transcriptional regulator n=1 Tax=Salipiger bermudensis TaxID=344736 RepID=UPI003513AE63